MRRILNPSFFNRSAVKVARDLIGCRLVRRLHAETQRFLITETEGYEGPDDRASHASRGKTERTKVMFGKPGIFYVYLVYGLYWMLNVVTGREGYPAAVLIRGTGKYSGPGRLTRALKISGAQNGKPASKNTGLWFERGIRVVPHDIKRTPRVGVAYASPVWSKKLYRFVLNRNLVHIKQKPRPKQRSRF